MEDKHLNIFFSYNADNQLIENNMTRGLIVALKTLSQGARNEFLFRLLSPYVDICTLIGKQDVRFALQGNIPISKNDVLKIPHKYIIALTGTKIIEGLDNYQDKAIYEEIRGDQNIRPDAWIFQAGESPAYCFLIECKMPDQPLFAEQIIAYAKFYFAVRDFEELTQRVINLTWDEIVETCDLIRIGSYPISKPEASILRDLKEFLSICGVTTFKGIDLSAIIALPEFVISGLTDIDFREIPDLPAYNFAHDFELGFENIPILPDYDLRVQKK